MSLLCSLRDIYEFLPESLVDLTLIQTPPAGSKWLNWVKNNADYYYAICSSKGGLDPCEKVAHIKHVKVRQNFLDG